MTNNELSDRVKQKKCKNCKYSNYSDMYNFGIHCKKMNLEVSKNGICDVFEKCPYLEIDKSSILKENYNYKKADNIIKKNIKKDKKYK